MIRSKDHAIDLIAKRKANGKKGIPKAVRRWCKRNNDPLLIVSQDHGIESKGYLDEANPKPIT